MNVAELIKDGLISEDIANVIFSTDEYEQEDRLEETSLIPTSYRVCSVYLSLIHAYVVGEAIYRGTTVDLLPYKHISSWILKIWDTSKSAAFNETSILSMLTASANDDSSSIFFGPSAVKSLCRVRDAYRNYVDPESTKKVDLREISVEDFKDLLRALPLLRSTRIDKGNVEIVFSLDSKTEFRVKCYPFIGYWDAENAKTCETDKPKNEGGDPNSSYVLVDIYNGANNSTIRAEIMVLDEGRDLETGKRVTRLVQYSSNNEYIRMICTAVKHPIEWVSIDNSVCDLAFIETLATTVSNALSEFWETYPEFSKMSFDKTYIAKSLKRMFKTSPKLYEAIDENSEIEESDLINTFYGLFIQHGVFKTMHGLFLDSAHENYGDKLFEIYIRHMTNITDESKAAYKTKCEENIEQHLLKLKGVIPENSLLAFDSRARGIRAECRAQCALKAAGLRADKLFVEQEEIRSIDNFYYMIKNSSTQLLDDLKNVLSMLVSFYRAILLAGIPFSKRKFHKDMWRVKNEIANLSVLELLNEFYRTVKNSEKDPVLYHYVGRERICNPQTLKRYITSLSNLIPQLQETTPESKPSPQVFISYSHADLERVKRYTDHFKKNNIPIYMDETEFHTGDKWISTAKDYIHSCNCKAVVVFLSKNSVQSKAVSYEIGAAVASAKDKYRDRDIKAKERFIIPVNLEPETVEEYLHNKLDRPDDEAKQGFSRETSVFARKIADCIPPDKINKASDDWNIEGLEKEIKEQLNVRFDGSLDESQRQYNDLEFAVASLYAFFKFGEVIKESTPTTIDRAFTSHPVNGRSCIFPLVTSVKETRLKRDNITLMGYEIVGSKELEDKKINYILSSRKLPPDDYYCLPNSRTTAKDCAWMVEPLLVSEELFIKPPAEDPV